MKNNKFLKIMSKTVVASVATLIYTTNVFASAGVVSIAEGSLNVRALPDVNSEIVSYYENGSNIEVIGVENDFFAVNHNGEKRYVFKDFVSLTESNGVVTGNGVNIRTAPVNGEVMMVASEDQNFTVTGYENDWYQVSLEGQTGYINSGFINVDMTEYLGGYNTEVAETVVEPEITTYALVTGTGVNLRSDMSTESEVLTVLGEGYVVDVENETEEWAEVSFMDTKGYVSTSYLDVNVGEKPEQPAQSKGNEIIDFAKGYIGTPYKWGGTSLTSGVDCSGFTQSVFKNFGISINRVAVDQYKNGYKVSKSELQAGDLLFFDTSGGNNGEITHVGIYMGDGNFIHSSSSAGGIGITVTSLSKTYYVNAYVGATRVID